MSSPRVARHRGPGPQAVIAADGPLPAPAAVAGTGANPVPELASYDQIVVSISGGKDSQAALHRTVLSADAAGVLDRSRCSPT